MTATTARQILLLAGKDLRIEARSRQTIGLVTVLGILIIVVLGLGLGGKAQSIHACAILWVAYLFSGVLCFDKTMAVERHDGALAALLMAPIDRGALYVAKLLANLALLAGVSAVVTAAGVLFFGFDVSSGPLWFAAIIAAGLVGFAAVGTLFAAVVSSTKLEGGLLALMIFPVTLPLVIASTQLLLKLFRDGIAPGAGDIGILVAFDVIFVTVSWVVFEFVLEP
jgi:heme exporter protein B